MTDLEITKLCAEAMGYRTFKEKRGEFTLCVAVAPDSPMPWERKRAPDPHRYQEVGAEEAMKIGFFGTGLPDPLHDDAQAMALVKKFGLSCLKIWNGKWQVDIPEGEISRDDNLNRSICECVAKMQLAKRTESESEKQ